MCMFAPSAIMCRSGLSVAAPEENDHPLTVIVIGDVGEAGSVLRRSATYISDMYTGRHDGGKFDAILFLGDNFYNTGLNIPSDDVQGMVKSILGPFKLPLEGLGRKNVHAVAGNHDWYERNVLEKSLLFGLISVSDGPIGLTDKGNKRAAGLEQWTYYYAMPAEVAYPLGGGSPDSVQFVFFDSALPLRTDPSSWRPALDSLRELLVSTRNRKFLSWRILALHHPFYSIGEHGGYSVWNDESNRVEYQTQCDKDTNALAWFKNWFDPEDLCAEKYQQMLDSLRSVLNSSGVNVQLALAGHDHSLQLLYYPDRDNDCDECPKVHVVSGAGSKPARVRFPAPPEYTSAEQRPDREGQSLPGFTQLQFHGDSLRIVFFNANNGNLIDMGEGRTEFWVDKNGNLMEAP